MEASTFKYMIINYALADLGAAYLDANPGCQVGAINVLASQGPFILWVTEMVVWLNVHTSLKGHYYLLATIAVATGWSDPDTWPDFFGKWSDAYTLRRFWG
jgi:hypothetical protein